MRQLFQPITAFVNCNRQAAAGRRSRCKRKFPRASRRLRNWTGSELRPWAEFS